MTRKEEYLTWSIVDLVRKVDQHWEMAGLARLDGDEKDATRHIALAKKYQRRLEEVRRG